MTAPTRAVYTHEEQKHVFNPRSIAVYGMSTTETSMGKRAVAQLAGYTGRILYINPKYEKIGDQPCYPNVRALPEVPDCVLFAIPREGIEKAVQECADAGVPGVIVFASGYAETGKPERIAEQERLAAIARKSGMKIIGPNCMGYVTFATQTVLSFTSTTVRGGMAQPTGIGIVSQSGALGFGLAQSVENGVVVSHVIATGNSCDVNIADNIAFLAEEPSCHAIACVFEGMSDPAQLLQAAELCWKAGKPLVIAKIGTGEAGAAAAISHTGSLAGSTAAYRAAFERTGAVMIDGVTGVMEIASFLSKAGRPKGRGVAIIATSGGGGIATADKAEAYGVAMPEPRGEVKKILEANVPEYGSPRNPCDITTASQTKPEILTNCAEALMDDDLYSTMIYPGVTLSHRTGGRRKALSDMAKKYDKPICLPFVGGWTGGPGTADAERDRGLCWFFNLDDCFRAISAWHWREDKRLAEEKNGPRKLVRVSPADAKGKAAKLIKASNNTTLTEREAKEVLACYGVPVVGEKLVQSADEAVKAATLLGLPVAMKVESPDIPHKTEAGVIRLNLKTTEDVKAAYDVVMANASKYNVKARINGVLVQPMAPSGAEIMVGATIDPQFGPLIVVGIGGVMVELLKDSALELAPVTKLEARAMLGRLRSQKVLEGFRGAEPVDQDKLADIVVRLSEFTDDQRELIAELDVNPLICAGSRIVAVDALIVKKS